ncbi:hypothetical protein HU200_041257 [Digitaria exilis]|uniref:Uncharacterized protein n=1 Tax=Digitaria exilis TaxID=1010633 RepID=A0A835B5L7_9POAL|nr:hypothetical protein HU200_041257 [Digitaria exilis]
MRGAGEAEAGLGEVRVRPAELPPELRRRPRFFRPATVPPLVALATLRFLRFLV